MLLRETASYILLCIMCLFTIWGECFQRTTNTTSQELSCSPHSPCWRPGMSPEEHIWSNVYTIACTNNNASLGICRSPNTAVPRHFAVYIRMSFSRQGWSHRALANTWCWWCTCPSLGWKLYTTRSHPCCARAMCKPTKPPDSMAGPKGSFRTWTSPSNHLPLSCPTEFPSWASSRSGLLQEVGRDL